eukprot:jgi/Psemu1/52296/gm1.52296_g
MVGGLDNNNNNNNNSSSIECIKQKIRSTGSKIQAKTTEFVRRDVPAAKQKWVETTRRSKARIGSTVREEIDKFKTDRKGDLDKFKQELQWWRAATTTATTTTTEAATTTTAASATIRTTPTTSTPSTRTTTIGARVKKTFAVGTDDTERQRQRESRPEPVPSPHRTKGPPVSSATVANTNANTNTNTNTDNQNDAGTVPAPAAPNRESTAQPEERVEPKPTTAAAVVAEVANPASTATQTGKDDEIGVSPNNLASSWVVINEDECNGRGTVDGTNE